MCTTAPKGCLIRLPMWFLMDLILMLVLHAVREETPDGVRWELYGAEADEVSVKNLCLGSDETDSLSMQGGNGALLVEYRADPAAGFGATNCVFLVVGDLRALT